jgi:hypothetical protein
VSATASSTPPGAPGLFVRLRAHLSLSRAQAIFGLIAACLSIGGTVYGYLRVTRPPDTGELVAFVRDRADKPLPDATIEVLTPKDALVTSLTAIDPAGARYTLKEGTYRLRVSHPKLATETRTVQVIAGQTSEIRFRLGPRAAAASPGAVPGGQPLGDAVETLRKILR